MDTLAFTRIQDDQNGIVATAEYRGRIALVKIAPSVHGTRVTVQVDGATIEQWRYAAG
jgi:hypothetical protein